MRYLAVALVAFVSAAGQEAPQGFSIAGVVANAATNTPLSKALVQIASTRNAGENRLVVTGEDGRFQFNRLPQEKFQLTVSRQSGPPHGFMDDDNYATAIVTGPDQNTTQIVFQYRMPGSIKGTVVDENGESVRNAQVHLFARRILNGVRRTSQVNQTMTRESGSFTFSHLVPGTYLIAVSGRPWFAQNNMGPMRKLHSVSGNNIVSSEIAAPPPDPQFDVAYPFTYYSGALDPASASPVTVSEGGTATVRMSLRAVPAIHVHFVNGSSSKPDAQVNVQAMIIGPEGHPIMGGFNQSVTTEGGGELTGIAPGRYQLAVNSFNRQEGVRAPDTPRRLIVDLVDGATVDLSGGSASHISVKATVAAEGNDQPQNRIGLMLRDPATGNGIPAMNLPDKSFQFAPGALAPGRYDLFLPNTPAFHVKSVEAKGAKYLGGELILEDNSDVQLAVTIARGQGTKLEGFAVSEGRGAVGAMVLLVPRKGAATSTIFRDQSDSDGSFSIANVPAGTYLAIAIDHGHDLAYADPAVLQPYLAGGQSVVIGDPNNPPQVRVNVQARQP